jgi:hypothetical protein
MAGVAGSATRPSPLPDLRNWYLALHRQLGQARHGAPARSRRLQPKNSTYPRSRLREMNGDEMASWSNRTGTHIPSVRQLVATDGRIDVLSNGRPAGSIPRAAPAGTSRTGSYPQSDTEKGDAADAVGKVVLYQVRVIHAG